jgi:hypothetical protein
MSDDDSLVKAKYALTILKVAEPLNAKLQRNSLKAWRLTFPHMMTDLKSLKRISMPPRYLGSLPTASMALRVDLHTCGTQRLVL